MHKILIAAVFAVALAGCKPDTATDQAAKAQDARVVAEKAPQTSMVSVEPALPGTSITINGQGITFPFAHALRYDRIGETKSLRKQRQTFFEVKGADVATVVTQLVEQMTKAGYKAGAPKEEKGGQRVSFRKKGVLSVSALVRPKSDKPKLNDPEATASLYMTITAKPAK